MVDLKLELFWWCPWGSGVRLSVLFPSDYCLDKYVGPGWPRASDGLGVPTQGNCLRCHCLSSLSALCRERCLELMASPRLTGLKGFYFRPKQQRLSAPNTSLHPQTLREQNLFGTVGQSKQSYTILTHILSASALKCDTPSFLIGTTMPHVRSWCCYLITFFWGNSMFFSFTYGFWKAWEVQVFVKTNVLATAPVFSLIKPWAERFLYETEPDKHPVESTEGNIKMSSINVRLLAFFFFLTSSFFNFFLFPAAWLFSSVAGWVQTVKWAGRKLSLPILVVLLRWKAGQVYLCYTDRALC